MLPYTAFIVSREKMGTYRQPFIWSNLNFYFKVRIVPQKALFPLIAHVRSHECLPQKGLLGIWRSRSGQMHPSVSLLKLLTGSTDCSGGLIQWLGKWQVRNSKIEVVYWSICCLLIVQCIYSPVHDLNMFIFHAQLCILNCQIISIY